MDKRITLVTGASRGIGRASALALSAAGHHVIAMARSKLALEKLDDEITAAGGSVTLIPMDLKDKAGFETVGNVLAGRYGRLDGLLGNAGVLGTLGPIQSVGPRSFEETIEVNLTANWRLIRAMAPLMQRSETPRAVFITSGSTCLTPAPPEPACAPKPCPARTQTPCRPPKKSSQSSPRCSKQQKRETANGSSGKTSAPTISRLMKVRR